MGNPTPKRHRAGLRGQSASRPDVRGAVVRVALGFTLLAVPACRVTLPHDAATQPASAAMGNAELMEHVSAQPLVTAEIACRVGHALWKGETSAAPFEELLAALKAGDVAPGHWNPGPTDCVDRALVGYLVCRAVDIRTGLNWRLTGLGRYAWRELQYRRIAGPGSDLRLISGGEFLGVISRAGEYLAARSAPADGPIDLGPPP